MISLASIIASVIYLVLGALLTLNLVRGKRVSGRFKTLMLVPMLAAVALHSFVLYDGIHTSAGKNLALFQAASLVAWLMVLLWLMSLLSKPTENLAVVILPVAAVAILLEVLLPERGHVLHNLAPGMLAHIFISILAYSLLGIAAIQAVLLWIQDRQLHNRHPGGFVRALPPLQVMESLLFQMIALGFIVLTFSLFSGVLFLENIFAQHLVHKTVLSILSWLVFAVLLWGRWRLGWRGKTAIRWTLGGFFSLMLAYFGTKFVLELILHR
jgi:ABC-type uncharacterized transport system permease subunit